jgi:hypothetical protein
MRRYKESVLNALIDAFPEHNWEPWKFSNISHNTWKRICYEAPLRTAFIADMASKLGVSTLEDWYRVSVVELQKAGIKQVPAAYGGLKGLLEMEYPDHPWQADRFGSKSKRTIQRTLKRAIVGLFKNHEGTKCETCLVVFPVFEGA